MNTKAGFSTLGLRMLLYPAREPMLKIIIREYRAIRENPDHFLDMVLAISKAMKGESTHIINSRIRRTDLLCRPVCNINSSDPVIPINNMISEIIFGPFRGSLFFTVSKF